jgi:hypothetical protein
MAVRHKISDRYDANLGRNTMGIKSVTVALGRTGGNRNHQWLTAKLISGTVTESGRLTA